MKGFMLKYLLLPLFLMVWMSTQSLAQLFSGPDTVCIEQPINLKNLSTGGSSFYWGFCSGYLANTPLGTNLGTTFGLDNASGIQVAKDASNNYFGFIVNKNTNSLIRLNFGGSLNNVPSYVPLGNLNNTLPQNANSIYLIQESGSWYLYVVGGTGLGNSTIARLDFGTSLANLPNGVNFGNPGVLLNAPTGLFIAKEGTDFYGFLVNGNDNKLIRFDIGNNISLSPRLNDLGNLGGLNSPSDLAGAYDGNNWFFLITNAGNNTLSTLLFSSGINQPPTGNNVGSLGNKLFTPKGISLAKDCDGYYAYITNGASNEIVKLILPTLFSGTFSSVNLGGLSANFKMPSAISDIIRDHDELFAFVTNATNNSLSQIRLGQCTSSTIASSTLATPPTYQYQTPGLFNVFMIVDEGLPTAAFQCHQIRVLPKPPVKLSNDTLICQGDTIKLVIQSINANQFIWTPNYAINDTSIRNVSVWPAYSLNYKIQLNYANGCIIDTTIAINVSKNKADAGPDRFIFDGASTVLGGPYTSRGNYIYQWYPAQYIDNPLNTNPLVTPPHDFTYYLEVRNVDGCKSIDTVIVHVDCNGVNLPNVFTPDAKGPNSKFGLLNQQFVQLNQFSIFDRWGQLMFETTDATKQWDGQVNGKPAPMGVYVWVADAFCTSGKRLRNSGNVTLIR